MFGCRATLPIDLDTSKAELKEKIEQYLRAEEADLEKRLEEKVKQLEETKENVLTAQQSRRNCTIKSTQIQKSTVLVFLL